MDLRSVFVDFLDIQIFFSGLLGLGPFEAFHCIDIDRRNSEDVEIADSTAIVTRRGAAGAQTAACLLV